MNDSLITKYIEGTATEQEMSAVRNYLLTDENAEYIYDIIFKMRDSAMKKLGIENDFMSNENK
jgi:hypothetical protein